VFQVLDPIPAGIGLRPFLHQLEVAVEGASDALAREAGFTVPVRTATPPEVERPPV
jgi:1-acyl-sn-glycerol-3-phosphate acyltransferase